MSRHFRSLVLACTFVIFANGFPQSNRSTELEALKSKYQPYTVALKYKDQYICSGVIIGPSKILTSRMCMNKCKSCNENLTVYAGSSNLSSGGNVYLVESIAYSFTLSQNFSSEKQKSDTNLVTINLASPINFSDKVQPIALPDKDIVEGSTAVTSGWGLESQNVETFNVELQNFKRNIITADKCNTEYLKDVSAKVNSNEFCGTPTDVDNNGFCAGNSGSPLIQDGKVIGIAIWGVGCSHKYPDVYANVYQHLSFLDNSIEEFFSLKKSP